MKPCVLFIDGENFLHKLEEVLKIQNTSEGREGLALVDLTKLLKDPLKGLNVIRKIFYASKVRYNKETSKKSIELISFQRKLRNNLVKHGFEFIIAGNVRAQKIDGQIIFREKGVDVKIAVDLVALACDRKLATAIICSSDSDLQPAVSELKGRKVKTIYLGFEASPNKGLSYTTDRTILIRNHEVLEAVNLTNV
ncbi:hypothetical protein COT49_03135 [candidate division WWE3 bacterium CG08_land_8_20_14_0_20_40_13]|uniref:NYN domain-containing protein n=1 Tax=candidate division WWE3 bacterium CG08_land_8_20_14_0_20_40_13 TaxID=1975084 RepID=A0A2H0XD82_UNCKA|nr:MAG: hypothetical protein COT49_03135 [candidate division WWE3 bacterium CG08_land_8_20_14_0_20_40_13]